MPEPGRETRPVRRGDVWWLDWNPGRGSEQKGRRPGLVIQNDVGNQHSPTTIVAAVTTQGRRGLPILVHVTSAQSGLPDESFINVAHVLTVDRTRLSRRAGRLSARKLSEVDRAIAISLGLEPA